MLRVSNSRSGKVLLVASHPIQYYSAWYRGLSQACRLKVLYCHRQSAAGQAAAGFGVEFDWDVDLAGGFESEYLVNVAKRPSTDYFRGCDTPEIGSVLDWEAPAAVIVMGWYLKAYIQAILAARRRGIPVLVRGDSQLGMSDSLFRRTIKRAVYPVFFRRVDAFLVVGSRFRQYLQFYGVSDDRMFFVPHCVDTQWFIDRLGRREIEEAAMRRWPDSKKGALRVLFVGKLIEKKRPLDLVHAVARLVHRGTAVDLAFAGDGILRQKVVAEASHVGVNVRMLGFVNQSELPGIYASADVLVVPSDFRETWGLVVNEAMACGTPAVVSVAVGCAPDLIMEGLTGAIFPCGDVNALAAAIERVIPILGAGATQAALRERLGRYSVDAAVAGTLQALDRVQEKAGGHAGRERRN